MMRAERGMWLVMVLLGLGGAGLVVWLLMRHGAGDIAGAVAAARWWLAVAVGFHIVPLFLDVLGWRTLFPAGQRPRVGRLLAARWIGESVSGLLPVAQVGGDIVRIRLAALRDATMALAVATVLADMTISVATQIVFTLSGLALLLIVTGRNGLTEPVLATCLISAVLVVGFYAVQRVGMFRLMDWIVARSSALRGIMRKAKAWDQEVRAVYARRGAILACVGWTCGTWVTGAVEMWIALWAVGAPTGYAKAYILESMGQGIRSAMFLIPGALGVQEGCYLLVGTLLGIPPSAVLAAAMIRRVRELAFAVPGLIAWEYVEGRQLLNGRAAAANSGSLNAP
jgi:putative membrane protein